MRRQPEYEHQDFAKEQAMPVMKIDEIVRRQSALEKLREAIDKEKIVDYCNIDAITAYKLKSECSWQEAERDRRCV